MEILFSWNNDIHLVVFSLCHFFLLDEQYILPLFKASLRIRYAMHYNKYVFVLFLWSAGLWLWCPGSVPGRLAGPTLPIIRYVSRMITSH